MRVRVPPWAPMEGKVGHRMSPSSQSPRALTVGAPSRPKRKAKPGNAPNGASDAVKAKATPKEKPQPMSNDQYDYDVCVIGSGPGGYVAAIRAAQYGLKTVCVEKEHLGGACLNWGCIPTKVMVASIERLEQVRQAERMGIAVGGEPALRFAKMMERKDKVVLTLRGGVGTLFRKNGVELIAGTAAFIDPHTIGVTGGDGTRKVSARNIIVATGSKVTVIPIPGLKGEGVWTSDDAVSTTEVPRRMLILGGGAVGAEFAYIFSGAGTEVTLVEMLPHLVPTMDEDLGKELERLFKRRKIGVLTGSTIEKAERAGGAWRCALKMPAGAKDVEVDVVLLGVGRRANTDGLNLDKVGVKTHERGIEVVNDRMQTAVPSIYAIGDVIGRIMLAHVASAEGLVAAADCAGRDAEMDYRGVPDVVYTVPELAKAGLTEKEAREKGYDVKTGVFPFRPLGRAMAAMEQDGFVKVVAESSFGEVLGVHIIGPHASSLIHQAAAAIKLEATLDDVEALVHAHPSFGEVLGEAYRDASGRAIHKT
jgi:dihydrolipoamide dehydrogenase